jgi:hypothetical protein
MSFARAPPAAKHRSGWKQEWKENGSGSRARLAFKDDHLHYCFPLVSFVKQDIAMGQRWLPDTCGVDMGRLQAKEKIAAASVFLVLLSLPEMAMLRNSVP